MIDTIDTLRNIYTIILALAVTEAFGQFAKPTDCSDDPARRDGWPFHWDRLLALVCILLLVVPFLHGMNQYLRHTYVEASSAPHPAWLLMDVAIFSIEAVVIFLLSRNLRRNRWRSFYGLIAVLLLLDAAWGGMVYRVHDADTVGWAKVNGIAGPLLLLMRWKFAKSEGFGPMLCCLFVIATRTFLDYWTSWDFYFPLAE